MKTLDMLSNPEMARLLWPSIIAGLGIAAMCSVLSVFVVLKRLSFIGQGVSHAAFGGIGVAAVLGLMGTTSAAAGGAQFAIVLAFCIGAAWLMGSLTSKGSGNADTAIGIVLVASMALGAALFFIAWRRGLSPGLSWESVLFGSILGVGKVDAQVVWVAAAVTAVTIWLTWRPTVFWAFDEEGAAAFGVNTARAKYRLLTLLALATVTGMKLAGVVLATAMLVLPGATALRLSDRLPRVLLLSIAVSLVGVLGGLVASFELDLPAGACIVGALTVLYAFATVISLRSGRS